MILDILRAREVFDEIAALDESVFALDRAALAICLEEYPNLDFDEHLRKLDRLAARVEMLVGENRDPYAVLEALNEVLFVQEGFKGNTEDYYNPRNSYLNEVLDLKLGIPITLSLIYMEVARRVRFSVHGVGLPGHFLVKYVGKKEELLIDPFSAGRILSPKDCQDLLDRVYGGSVKVQPAFLHPMEKRAIISRMLFNLKGIYYQREEYQKALSVVERILILNPETPSEIRDRGLLYMQTSLFARALADLQSYMKQTTAPEDSANIEGHIRTLRSIVTSAN